MIALWLLACSTPPSTPTPPDAQRPEDCRRYADPGQAAYCVSRLVGRGQATVADCQDLGDHAEACQLAWVTRALSQGSGDRDALLEHCRGAGDCALAVLDARPGPSVTADLAACREHAGPYAQDCTIHRLQSWVASRPDAASFARVAAETDHPATVGALLGLVVACQGVGRCDQATGASRSACTLAVEQDVPSRPEICQLALGGR